MSGSTPLMSIRNAFFTGSTLALSLYMFLHYVNKEGEKSALDYENRLDAIAGEAPDTPPPDPKETEARYLKNMLTYIDQKRSKYCKVDETKGPFALAMSGKVDAILTEMEMAVCDVYAKAYDSPEVVFSYDHYKALRNWADDAISRANEAALNEVNGRKNVPATASRSI